MADRRRWRLPCAAALSLSLAACASLPKESQIAPVTADLAVPEGGEVALTYRLANKAPALHFASRTGDYRETAWQPLDPAFRWIADGDSERLERIDGQPFDRATLTIPARYRSLVKSYGPFSPFSDGSSTLVYSGQFHACAALPCEGDEPLPMRIDAPGRAIAVPGRRDRGAATFVSEGSGSNIFIGRIAPVAADGFNAIIDPGLPDTVRTGLATALPAAMDALAAQYGPLSQEPDLYVSIDRRRQPDGNVSIQGGTLPRQIFMHFDGDGVDGQLSGPTDWIDWFFAHEAAHLFQQELAGSQFGDNAIAWIHEGGADALSALVFEGQGRDAYVRERSTQAREACRAGLAERALTQAASAGAFDMHYQCGMILALALDRALRSAGSGDLHQFNRRFFEAVRQGADWSPETWFAIATATGAGADFVADARSLTGADRQATLAALDRLAAGR